MSNSTRMIGLRLTGVLVVAVAASFSLLVLGAISVKANPQTVVTTYVNVGLQLDALKDNGGPTWTHALLPGSPAINAGNPTGCLDAYLVPLKTDQRGFLRTVGSRCDIGAYEAAHFVELPLVRH